MTKVEHVTTVTILAAFVFLTSCKSGDKKDEATWSDLPQVTRLNSLKQTEFVPTLENPISDNKNVIYAPAFLYAWDKVEQELKSQIVVSDTNSVDFKLLTQSNSYQHSLADSEYSVDVDLVDGAIIARAYFNKSLPFETNLESLNGFFVFDNREVDAFGMFYYDENAVKFTRILYYKDDNNFIIKLIPKDNQHEIILVKGLTKVDNLAAALKQTTALIIKGQDEQSDSKQYWKYEITPGDMFAIPSIKFNIATNYMKLEGQTFTTNGESHFIETAYQRTGFILNENGAVVESEAYAATDSAGAEPIITHPKKMIFDSTFYIIIKRTDKTNPYFVMKVDNAELMTKE